MLKWMHLENLALVESADLEFGRGFNVISGETGAGKSVIMGGVGLLLGERADRSMIRIGADRCEISGEFQVDASAAEAVNTVLEEFGIKPAGDGSLLIRRVITPASGRNFVNESPVTLQVLHRLGSILVDIHGASENHHLLKVRNQLDMLDRFGGLDKERKKIRSIWEELAALRKEREAFAASMPSAEETARYRHDAEEIEKAAPQEGEDDALEEKHALAAHSKTLIELASGAADLLSEQENSIQDQIGSIRRMISDMERCDPNGGAKFLQETDELADRIAALSGELSDYASDVEVDEGEFMQMEERLRILQTLRRRYGPTLTDVLAYLAVSREKIDAYDNAETHRQEFAAREKKISDELNSTCAVLTKKRIEAGKEVALKTVKELRKLGFAKAEFSVALAPCEPGPEGADKIEFMFSANPGVPPMPLRDVASSGEISRVMLALKTVLAEADAIPILIFDEIDANIGGETASMVGDEIAVLAKEKQILCISHLAQIACRAGTQFQVFKETKNEQTFTHIRLLNKAGRADEIARMLGGGEAAHALAEKMLARNTGIK